jgi:hypothetical protein
MNDKSGADARQEQEHSLQHPTSFPVDEFSLPAGEQSERHADYSLPPSARSYTYLYFTKSSWSDANSTLTTAVLHGNNLQSAGDGLWTS